MSKNNFTSEYTASEARNKSPAVLAFVGDAYFGLLVRTRLAAKNRPSGELHRLSVGLVNASAQSAGFEKIKGLLSEAEHEIFRRGRNFHTVNVPKSSTRAEYHTATGLEALFGYLYLSGQKQRAEELFEIMLGSLSD